MSAKVTSLTDLIEERDKRQWDAAARQQGFQNYAALQEAYEKEFDVQMEWL